MSFTSQLIHNYNGQHLQNGQKAITSFLPKNVAVKGIDIRHLLYPLAAGRISMPASLALPFNGFPAYGMLYVSAGSGSFSTGADTLSLFPGNLLIFSCDNGFSINSKSPWEYFLIYFNGNSAFYFYDSLSGDAPFLLQNAYFLETDIKFLQTACEKGELISVHRILTDIFCESLSCMNASENAGNSSLPAQIRQYLDSSYTGEISLPILEEQFGINKYRLCREFQSAFGISPMQYLHQIRIRHAQKLLTVTSAKIHEVSEQVGYGNTNLFIKHFKAVSGCTPGAYRHKKTGSP